MFNISEVDKGDSDLAWLVSELDAFQNELYPAESNHCLELYGSSPVVVAVVGFLLLTKRQEETT